jgi:endoplasmic reticulum resident protein 44
MAIVGVHHCLGAVILLLVLQIYRINGEAVHLNKENLEEFKRSKKIMLMNFYADWCRYSSALKPIYDKAADQISTETNEAILAKIDCERSKPLCHEFQIIKYPTVKIIRNGELIQKEYRGQRTTEAIVAFVRNQIKNPIQTVSSYSEFVGKVEKNTKAVVGVFVSNETEQYGIFQRVAFKLKDDCKFFAVIDKDQNVASQMSFRDQEVRLPLVIIVISVT